MVMVLVPNKEAEFNGDKRSHPYACRVLYLIVVLWLLMYKYFNYDLGKGKVKSAYKLSGPSDASS